MNSVGNITALYEKLPCDDELQGELEGNGLGLSLLTVILFHHILGIREAKAEVGVC